MSIFKTKPESAAYFLNFEEGGVSWSTFQSDKAVKCESKPNPMLEILRDEGLVENSGSGYKASWQSVYTILQHDDVNPGALGIPSVRDIAPTIESLGTLTDKDFGISISDWREINGSTLGILQPTGAAFKKGEWWLLPEESWKLRSKILEFWKRPEEQRTHELNRQNWSQIRQMALAAKAEMTGFLYKCIVITPDKLKIDLRRGDALGTKVIEVIPSFNECPENWLDAFDKQNSVLDEYVLPTKEGVVQILLKPEVKSVLKQIKQMPGRRAASQRAEAFVINPFAALGEDAINTIDIEEFEQARAAAGMQSDRFFAFVGHEENSSTLKIGLRVLRGGVVGEEERYEFASDELLSRFIQRAEKNLADGMQLIAWEDFEFEILGDTRNELETIKEAQKLRQNGKNITKESVFNLTKYGARIIHIGEQPIISSPHIPKPESVKISIDIYESTSNGAVNTSTEINTDDLKNAIDKAIANGDETVTTSWGEVISISKAQTLLVKTKGTAPVPTPPPPPKPIIPTLVIGQNVNELEYLEKRKELLTADKKKLVLPTSLRPECKLLDHQLAGVAQMQHLYQLGPQHARGVILADDMGLGKTLQTLTFISSVFELNKDASPALIVAPVSLLENWQDEIEKFFIKGSLPYLTAYGQNLSKLRVHKSSIDDQLVQMGLIKFLKDNWIGSAKIVLTTYETLRDLEFSFAAEKWSVMVCDEAQKIKNPNALVTRAALKQNVTFKIACTGTPVENSLADLWCLFDFIQSGYLGTLKEFANTYRRPIEAELSKDQEKIKRVNELRSKIEPQIIRRMKHDVCKDLPIKIFDKKCKNIPMSKYQIDLYVKAIKSYDRRDEAGFVTQYDSKLKLIQYLRAVSIDPRPIGTEINLTLSIKDYCKQTPKMGWLLETLDSVKKKSQKAIVFCEFRSIQIVLRHYIHEKFGFSPDIINGDTETSTSSDDSRKKRIDVFQQRPGFGVIVLSPIAVGFGVNIQEANHVIHYTRHWNPAKEDQATDRAYRIGQKQDVYVYTPVMTADFTTFEQKLDALLQFKRELSKDMLNGCGDVDLGGFIIKGIAPRGIVNNENEYFNPASLPRVKPLYFEGLIAALWRAKGYVSYLTPQHGDYGVDVVAINGNRGALIQCKTSKKINNRETWDAIKEVYTGKSHYERVHSGVTFELFCVTNNYFNENAMHHAKLNNVTLIERQILENELKLHPILVDDIPS